MGTRLVKGQRLHCSECETNLIITNLNPLEVEVALAYHSASLKQKANTVEIACPACDAFVKLSIRTHKGQQTGCQTCQTVLEVININPLELDIALPIPSKRNRSREAEW